MKAQAAETQVARHTWTGLALALVLLLALGQADAARNVAAQTALTLADFDRRNLDIEVLVLLQAPDPIPQEEEGGEDLWSTGRFESNGTVLDGGTSGSIPMLTAPHLPDDPNMGTLARIRRSSGELILNQVGGTGRFLLYLPGTGNDLHIFFQTADGGVASMPVSTDGARNWNADRIGGGYVHFPTTRGSDFRTVLNGIGAGERFIFALARARAATPEAPPAISSATASATTHTTATLRAAIQDGAGQERTVYFRWRAGATGTYSTGTASGTDTITLDLTGLTPSTEYQGEVSLASDYAGATAFTFTTLANKPPTFPYQTTTLTVLEGNGVGISVANPVTATDTDGDTLAYALSGADADSFKVQENGQIVIGRNLRLNHDTRPVYSLILTARDPYRGSASVAIIIRVEQRAGGRGTGTPPVIGSLRTLICLGGFPGCPDTFVFLIPTVLLGAILVKAERRRGIRRVEVLGAIWVGSFLVLGIVLGMDTLRLVGFCTVAVAVGFVFMAVRR